MEEQLLKNNGWKNHDKYGGVSTGFELKKGKNFYYDLEKPVRVNP